MRSLRIPVGVLLFYLCGTVFALSEADAANPVAPAGNLTAPPATVIGFVGGFVKHDNRAHSTVQVAEHLRSQYPAGVSVQVFENHRRDLAYQSILQALDLNHDGKLSAEEKQQARIILYGHSWGASETVTLARKLEKLSVPVLLTIQVDSVSKFGENDAIIPSNVGEAVNFYQPHGLVHGRTQIRAADPARTQIVGNFRFDYQEKPLRCEGYPWFNRIFIKPHTQIECDPRVWNQVESLIHSKLAPQVNQTASR